MQQELPPELIIAVERILEPNKEYRPVQTNVQDTLNDLFPNGWSIPKSTKFPNNFWKRKVCFKLASFRRNWNNKGVHYKLRSTSYRKPLRRSRIQAECKGFKNLSLWVYGPSIRPSTHSFAGITGPNEQNSRKGHWVGSNCPRHHQRYTEAWSCEEEPQVVDNKIKAASRFRYESCKISSQELTIS